MGCCTWQAAVCFPACFWTQSFHDDSCRYYHVIRVLLHPQIFVPDQHRQTLYLDTVHQTQRSASVSRNLKYIKAMSAEWRNNLAKVSCSIVILFINGAYKFLFALQNLWILLVRIFQYLVSFKIRQNMTEYDSHRTKQFYLNTVYTCVNAPFYIYTWYSATFLYSGIIQ